MELLDRYLQAVKFWLPRQQGDDIIAELSEDLRSQIEEKEGELGRIVNDDELEAILKRCGSPLAVAERYLPPAFLIGPLLFPLYRFVLKVILLGYVVPWLLVWIGFLIFDAPYRAANPGFGQIRNLWTLWIIILYCFSFTTAAFAILERSKAKARLLENWSLRKLPAVRDLKRIPRVNSLFEIAGIVVFNVWFISMFWPKPAIDLYGVQLVLAPVWKIIFSSYVVMSAANLAIACVNLFRPYWTSLRARLRLLTNAAGGGLFCWLLRAQIVLQIGAPGLASAKAASITNLVNAGMANLIWYAVAVVVVTLAVDLRRIIRLKTASNPAASQLAHA
ncbi:MAG: hypothetical protein WCF68_18865 [Terriglobales bacterium]